MVLPHLKNKKSRLRGNTIHHGTHTQNAVSLTLPTWILTFVTRLETGFWIRNANIRRALNIHAGKKSEIIIIKGKKKGKLLTKVG